MIEFFNEVVNIAGKNDLLSGEHFSVDGTLIQAWACHKSFVRKDGSDRDDARPPLRRYMVRHGRTRHWASHA